MKKKILTLLLAASMVMLAACGNKEAGEAADSSAKEEASADGEASASEEGEGDSELMEINGPQYLSEIKPEEYITLGEYKGIEVTLEEPEVTDDYLDGYIQYVLQNSPVSTPVTDRAAELGDTVNIDYEGKLDGVAFDGGTAAGQDLTLGSGQFIDGFEDGVVGMEIGDTKDVEATFPDPYTNNPDLAGKTAVFTVTVNSISLQEVPELTDEYVAGLGMEEYSNVEEYKNYMYEVLMEQEQQSYESEKSNLVIEAAATAAEMKEAPEGMTARMYNTLYNNISMYASMYGADVGTYVANVYGGEAEAYQDTLLAQAQMMAQRYIMMQAIADLENLSVSDEELEEQLAQEAEDYGYESAEAYKEAIDVEAYREYLMTQKVIAFLSENAVTKAGE